MLDREPFLKAIFAATNDHLPRLVFADYLDETDEPEWAARLRQECETDPTNRFRGFRPSQAIFLTEELLNDPDGFRRYACTFAPDWYGLTSLKLINGKVTTLEHLQTILASPVTEHVTELDLSGRVQEEPVELPATIQDGILPLYDLVVKPVITVPMVEQMVQMREVRRLKRLFLHDNELDNDAARALARSPHLFRLEQLKIYQGSRFKARTWQLLVERFGEQVVE